MKKTKLLAGAVALLMLSQTAVLAACKNDSPSDAENPKDQIEEVMPEFSYSTYNNTDLSNYSDDGTIPCENLPNQFDGSGIADPYVFRFNGTYYLYSTTQSLTPHMRGWKSKDMLHWEECTGAGLEKGWVSDDDCLALAYAPEVYYFNGKFYMYTSPAGDGHYILSADSPEGPFRRVTDNIHFVIDGSVFIDDDESMYFLNASNSGIEIHPMSAMDNISNDTTTLRNTYIGWTEGPMIIKKDGTYFLTYSGVHFLSDGYRVLYNTEQDGNPITSEDSFAKGGEEPLLLSVDGVYKGLGHSSTVLGPDMDSYYLVYHNMNKIEGNSSWRTMNVDRLLFNGTQMSVDGSAEGSIAANMPEFSADGTDGFENEGTKKLTKNPTDKIFTAEFNFKGDKVKCIVAYENENDYAYVQADYANHKITLYTVKNGRTTEAGKGTLVHDFDPEVIHTVRVAYADGMADVYFDNMCKIRDVAVKLGAGKIGYDGGDVYYTAYSDVARGYSDRKELKQSGAEIGAQTYLPEGEYEGLTSYKLTGSSKLTKFESEYENDANYDGAYKLKLAEEGDFARYATYFRNDGKYAMRLTYEADYCGRQIGVQIDTGEIKRVTLPDVCPEESGLVSAVITQIDIKNAGAKLITLYGYKRPVEYLSFSFSEVSGKEQTDLEEEYSVGGGRSIKYIGDGKYSDCEIEVQVKLNEIGGNSAGVILRADNFANSQYDDERSIEGYYVGLSGSEIFLTKYDYNYSKKRLAETTHGKSAGEWITLKVEINVNTVTVYLDGEKLFEYTDARAIASGYAGIYCEGARASFKNLTLI